MLQIEEPSLPLVFYLKRSLNQENRSLDTFLDWKGSLLAGHVSLDVSGAADIHLNVLLLDFFVSGKNRVVYVDAQFRDSVPPFGPSFLFVVPFSDSILELFHKVEDLLSRNSFLSPSVFELFAGDLVEYHPASCRPQGHNFSLFGKHRNHLFCELDCSVEILISMKCTVWLVHLIP